MATSSCTFHKSFSSSSSEASVGGGGRELCINFLMLSKAVVIAVDVCELIYLKRGSRIMAITYILLSSIDRNLVSRFSMREFFSNKET